MTECPTLTGRSEGDLFITKDNLYELIVNTYDTSPGTTVTVSCADGLTLVGDSIVRCLDSGSWNYQTKPHCTVETSDPVDTESDVSTTVIVGVVSAVAGVVIIILAIMLVVVYRRDRKFSRDSQKSTRSMISLSGHGREPPAPYNQHQDSFSHNSGTYGYKGPRRFERERERERDLESQLSNNVYLPPREKGEDWRDFFLPESGTSYYTGNRRPQIKSWVSRGPIYGNNRDSRMSGMGGMSDKPRMSGMAGMSDMSRMSGMGGMSDMSRMPEEPQYRRDPLLWRNAVLY